MGILFSYRPLEVHFILSDLILNFDFILNYWNGIRLCFTVLNLFSLIYFLLEIIVVCFIIVVSSKTDSKLISSEI